MKTLIAICMAVLLLGCAVKGPVNSASTVDDRPRISFDIKSYNPEDLELFVDNVSYGSAKGYLFHSDSSAEAALRILAGKHKIELRMGREIVFAKTDYFAEGMLKVFKVSR
ncbi:MAG: hypothetical protein P8X74_12915 [Reinekea sp.]|jgi:hypothetical protein